jgi:glutamate synthase domain-containing protein 2
MLEKWSRTLFIISMLILSGLVVLLGVWKETFLWLLVPVLVMTAIGFYDIFQTKHTILRNFPLLGHFRFLLESVRPEIYQYFIETEDEEHPFSREKRSVVYQRSKKVLDTVPFGTKRDVYAVGYEWVNHSIRPVEAIPEHGRVMVGGPDCKQPYSASIFNVSAMSFGALSSNAILALSKGAKQGEFYHNTGEGGISPHHLEGGADLVWQVGTGYFGCRDDKGQFCPNTFEKKAVQPAVKMVEIKVSQGAKPGHGGILPAAKVTPEIAAIRDVPLGQDVNSPPGHSAFSTPVEMMNFIGELRRLSGGKPVGFKLCIGDKAEFMSICKAMLQTGIAPDFITVDGAEGGTGAAPLELTNSVGMPLYDGLSFVHSTLIGIGLRDQIRIITAGKITTGFHLLQRLGLGADACNAARSMMFSLGCIQALKCNSNECPTGVATQSPRLAKGLVVADKSQRVANFHHATVESAVELMGLTGVGCNRDRLRSQIYRRVSRDNVQTLAEIYPCLEPGALLKDEVPMSYQKDWQKASAESF